MMRIREVRPVTILNLHRVGPSDGSAYRPMSSDCFSYLLDFVEAKFELSTFETCRLRSDKPRLIISFDDGYKDFLEFAVPLLDRRGIAVNQNVIPDCMETGLPPLNVIAQDFIGKAPRELVLKLDIPGFDIRKIPEARLGGRISSFLKERPFQEQRQLRDWLLPQFFAWQEFKPTPMMTLEEVRQLRGRHEIGAHSYAHATMQYQSKEFFEQDVQRCKSYFSNSIRQEMNIYAFPNGSHTPEQIQVLKEQGVAHILLVGNCFSDGGDVHRRFGFDAETKREIRFKALGGRRPVTC